MRYAAIMCLALIPLIWSGDKLKGLKFRADFFQEICEMLTTVKMRLQFDNPTTGELMQFLCCKESFKRLSFLSECLSLLKNDDDSFACVWERSIKSSEMIKEYLLQDDINALISFGKTLGTTDTEGQLLICEKCIEQFSKRKEFSASEKARLSKLYLTLAAAGAAVILILLI